jgi:Stigma-specific protein, Stig1
MRNPGRWLGMIVAGGWLAACSSNTGADGAVGADGAAGDGGSSFWGEVGSSSGSCDDAAASETAATDADVGTEGGSTTTPDGRCIGNAFSRDGVCKCQPDTPTACADACRDLATDPDNCGACGAACRPTSTCVAGRCGPPPTTFVAGTPGCGAMSLAAAGGKLYWTDRVRGTVMSGPTSCASLSPGIIATGERAPTGVLVRGGKVFWVDSIDVPTPPDAPPPQFMTTPNRGSSRSTIRAFSGKAISDVVTVTDYKYYSPEDTAIRGFTVSDDAATVYFSTNVKIRKASVSGGAPADVAIMDNGGFPRALALQGDLMAFPIDIEGYVDVIQISDIVARCWREGPNQTVLDVMCGRIGYGGALNMNNIAVAGDKMFWIDGNDVKMNALSVTALPDPRVVVANDAPVPAMALAGSTIYFTAFDSQAPSAGYVKRVPALEDSVPTPLARNVAGPGAIAVDGKKVFWSTSDCEIQTTGTGE